MPVSHEPARQQEQGEQHRRGNHQRALCDGLCCPRTWRGARPCWTLDRLYTVIFEPQSFSKCRLYTHELPSVLALLTVPRAQKGRRTVNSTEPGRLVRETKG